MKKLQIDDRSGRLAPAMVEDACGAIKKLSLPLRNLVDVHVELLRQLGQRLLALESGNGHFRLEGRCVVPACSLSHLLS